MRICVCCFNAFLFVYISSSMAFYYCCIRVSMNFYVCCFVVKWVSIMCVWCFFECLWLLYSCFQWDSMICVCVCNVHLWCLYVFLRFYYLCKNFLFKWLSISLFESYSLSVYVLPYVFMDVYDLCMFCCQWVFMIVVCFCFRNEFLCIFLMICLGVYMCCAWVVHELLCCCTIVQWVLYIYVVFQCVSMIWYYLSMDVYDLCVSFQWVAMTSKCVFQWVSIISVWFVYEFLRIVYAFFNEILWCCVCYYFNDCLWLEYDLRMSFYDFVWLSMRCYDLLHVFDVLYFVHWTSVIIVCVLNEGLLCVHDVLNEISWCVGWLSMSFYDM